MRSFAIATLLAAAYAVNAASITVEVGPNGTLTYQNSNINATKGDVITFAFQGGNHTVTQSSFADPCTHSEGGFASGYRSNGTYTVHVNNSSPLWYYCSQTLPKIHCFAGMVGAINASPANFTIFQNAAKALGNSSATSATSTASSTPTSTTSGSTSSASGVPGANSSSTATTAAMRVGGSTLGALTAMSLLVGLAI